MRWALTGALMLAACSADAPRTRECVPLAERWVVPAAPAPGLPAATLDGDIVDLAPLVRGEHAALKLSDGKHCAVVATPLEHVPVASEPRDEIIGAEVGEALAGADALVVTGADAGAEADGAVWDAALGAVGVSGRWLLAPARATFEAALAETCSREVVILVMTGQGTAAGGGALVLGDEAISYERVLALVAEHCNEARLAVVVIDSSYAVNAIATAATPAMILWRGSDDRAVDAPRVALGSGGALSSALAHALGERASGCTRSADPGHIAWLFREGDVRATMLAERWERIGVDALARVDGPNARAAIAHALEAQVPETLRKTYGAVPLPGRCTDDDDCAALDDTCVADACAHYGCHAGECVLVPAIGRPCDDGSDCTLDDACDNRGSCVGVERTCDDGNACTIDACEPGGCVAAPDVGKACDDGNPCSVDDACDADGACAGAVRVCDDGDPCTTDSCEIDNGGCVFVPESLACDDGDPCTFQDQCRNRVCQGTPRTCVDDDDCTADRCDPTSGACVFAALADGALCDDGDACTSIDRCKKGACEGIAATCDDGLACTFDACDDGRCTHLPEPGTCLSATGCIPVGTSPPESPCLTCSATDRLVAAHEGEPCPDDGIACTSDLCDDGVCRHRDAPDQCHDADGNCIAAGERVGECLRCEGAGIVTALSAGTACAGAEACAHGVCDGLGFCSEEGPLECCPSVVLQCGEVRVFGAADLDGATRIDQWSCVAEPTPGPERAIEITAPCDGTIDVALESVGVADQGLVLVEASACPTSSCSFAGPTHSLPVVQGQVVRLAIEVPTVHDWLFRSACTCVTSSLPRPR